MKTVIILGIIGISCLPHANAQVYSDMMKINYANGALFDPKDYIKRVDSNFDGVITYAEHLSYFQEYLLPTMDNEWKQHFETEFQVLDQDQNGELTVEEYRVLLIGDEEIEEL